MTAPAYTTDLVDIDLAQATTNWTNIGTGALAAETDFFCQNGICISKPGWTGDATRGAICHAGSGLTIPRPGAYFAWLHFWGPGALETQANGGLRMIIGSRTPAYNVWYVKGGDTIKPFDAWICMPLDPAAQAADATGGAPSATVQYFGSLARIKSGSAIGKGNPYGIDAIRYGRGTLQSVEGEASNYATFAGAEAVANSTTNRWGLFQQIQGGLYLQQRHFLMGVAGTIVDFRDSNRIMAIADTQKVISSFNLFEVRNASSRVDWTNITITALGTTARGNFIATNNATINKIGCVFTDMGTFGYLAASTITTTTYRRCQLITQAGATFSKCIVDSTADSVKAMISDDPSKISSCQFVSSGTKHALELTTPGTYTFPGNLFTGYATVDGSTGNEAIYNNSGGLVTINVTSGGGTPTIRNGSGASTVVNSNVSITLTGLKNPTEVRVYAQGTTTELNGQENVTTGSYQFSVSSGTAIDIALLSLGYQNMRLLNFSTTSDTALPISQQVDRQYLNP